MCHMEPDHKNTNYCWMRLTSSLQDRADARDVSQGYIAKSNPYIVMVSTPNAADGLFERIEKESEDVCLYRRIFLDYTYGISKIYTAQ